MKLHALQFTLRKNTLLIFLFLLTLKFSNAQICTGNCTMSISGQTTMNFNVYPGNILCIAAGSEILGDIYNYGGTVCNEGKISGEYYSHNGILNNYNEAATTSLIIMFGGTINNYQNINSYNLITHSTQVQIINNGSINCLEIDMNGDDTNSPALLENHGTLNAQNFHSDSSLIKNYGSFTTLESIHINEEATLINYGIMEIGQNYYNNGSSTLYCMAHVAGDLFNNGESSGPPYLCGGYTVDGNAFNNGNFGTNGVAIDLCKTNGSSGFDGSLGTIGPAVTYCSCTNSCTTQTASIDETSLSHVTIAPNPASSMIELTSSSSKLGHFEIYDVYGKQMRVFDIEQKSLQIDIIDFPAGIYFIKSELHSQKFVKI